MTTISLKKTFAALPVTTRGKALVINGDPKGKNFLYCNGKNVFIRNISDTSECDIYSQHSKDASVAKYSPSGYYIASGDSSGKIRIWDTVNAEHILKHEYSPLSGIVRDIDWTMDNTKILIVGEGRETFGKAIMWDSGNTTGELSGHTKSINSVAVKQSRPMKVATASEDFTTIFYEGPPFKFKCSKTDHGNFVNCIRYSPDGSIYISGSSDGKMFIYDGITSELKGELGAPKAHAGSVYSISFNKDGSKLLSASGDKTAKIWNIESKSVEAECKFGTQVDDMQLASLWQDDHLITVSLSGHINYLDPATAQIKKVVKGHNKPIMAMAVSDDGSTIYSGSIDGKIVSWNTTSTEAEVIKGKGHTNQINDMVLDGDYLVTVGMDDVVRFTKTAAGEYGSDTVKMNSQPKAVDSKNGVAVVGCSKEVVVLEAPGRKVSTTPFAQDARCVSIRPGGSMVAVGSDSHVHIFELDAGQLMERSSLPAEMCSSVAWSPDGAYLAACSKNAVMMYDVENNYENLIGAWGKRHTARVTDISWSPDGSRFASGGIDANLIVWDPKDFVNIKPMVKAHPLSHMNKVRWIDNNSILTAGHDNNLKLWTVSN